MRPKPVDLTKVKKILVCMFKFHGDVLLISSFLSALKRYVSHAQIECSVFSQTAPMLEGHPSIDKIIPYEKKKSIFARVCYEIKQLNKIRSNRYDLVFNMSQGDRGALFCLASRSKIRVGFDSLGKGFFRKNNVFTHLVGKSSTVRHVIEENLDPLRILGINPEHRDDKKLHLSIGSCQRQAIVDLLKQVGLKPDGFVVVHAMSRYEHKHWSSQKWAMLIQKLQQQGSKVILTGGPGIEQKAVVDEILGFLDSHEGVYNFCGKTSLKGLAALIQASRLLVTIDSVPLHMSSALSKPVVALFGPSIEAKWGPYQNVNARVVSMDLPCRSCDLEGCGNSWISQCMQTLPVEKVYDAIQDVLKCKAFAQI